MTTEEFLEYMNSGKQVTAECGVHQTIRSFGDCFFITSKIISGLAIVPVMV